MLKGGRFTDKDQTIRPSPKLLDVDYRTVEQMKLVNALCRFVEMAEPV